MRKSVICQLVKKFILKCRKYSFCLFVMPGLPQNHLVFFLPSAIIKFLYLFSFLLREQGTTVSSCEVLLVL